MPDLNYLGLSLESWTPLLLAVGVAVAVASVVFLVGARIVTRAVAKSPAAAAVARAIRAPASALLPLLAATSVIHSAEEGLRGLPSVQRLLLMLTIAAVTWLLSRAISGYGRAVVDANKEVLGDDLEARRVATQARVITRTLNVLVTLVGVSLALMTIPSVRQVGASLLASAGVIGIVAGFAARPVLGNLIAGLQIGLAQPIRIQDVVIVEGEWGVIEEIRGTYVTVRIWDDRRLVVPLQYWVEKPFQNWTRNSKELTGVVTMWVDYRMPMAPLREALQKACESCDKWDRRTCLLQVTEAGERAMQVRALVTAADAGLAWDLRCHVREALVDFMQREYPQFLPQFRIDRLASPAPAEPAPLATTATPSTVTPPRGTS
jgi:small-conductance mechanosensitive channel